MGELVYACVAPHGYEVVGEIAGPEWGKFAPTRAGMSELGLEMEAANPDVIVVVTPHGYRVQQHIAVSTNEHAQGQLSKFDVEVSMRFDCDVQFARELILNAQGEGLPAIEACYGSAAGSFSVLPLDWGSFIPLWFMGANWEKQPRIVVITPSRDVGVDTLVKFGETLVRTILASNSRIAVIASADQGHAHSEDGPYGYHLASQQYDRAVRQAVDQQALQQLMELTPDFIDAARPDSLWQMAVLYGIQKKVPLKSRVVSYQVPTYYGLMCASFQVQK